MKPITRPARIEDLPLLVRLMTAFYAESGHSLPAAAAAKAFRALIADPRRGRVWLIETEAGCVGYAVLVFAFSMEYGGLRGFVDDFFVEASMRGRGVGGAVLETLKTRCREMGVRELIVETGRETRPARGVYARAGFRDSGRVLLRQALAAPVHEQ